MKIVPLPLLTVLLGLSAAHAEPSTGAGLAEAYRAWSKTRDKPIQKLAIA
jgi:hypothetical protein